MMISLSGIQAQMERARQALEELPEQVSTDGMDRLTLDDWLYEHQPLSALYLAIQLIDHLALLHADRSRLDEFFKLYVDPPKPKEGS